MHRKLYTHVDANISTAAIGTHARPRSRLTGRFEFSRSRWPPREKRAGRPLSATFARRVCPPALRNRVNRYRPLAVGCLRTRHACNPSPLPYAFFAFHRFLKNKYIFNDFFLFYSKIIDSVNDVKFYFWFAEMMR